MRVKKILFIIGDMRTGGVSKSMINLLNTIDSQKYDITLLIGDSSGILNKLLPKGITLISDRRITFLVRGIHGLSSLLKHGYFFLFLGNLFRLCLSCINKGYAGWILSRLMPPLENEYDLIVDYNGQHQLYYMVDKLIAKKKITFFHSDYAQWSYYYSMDKKYMPKADYIFTVSEQCVSSLKHFFPVESNKINLFANISSSKIINQMALELVSDPLDKSCVSLISVGHVSKTKGTDRAIEAAKILKDRAINYKWYFLGENKHIEYYKKLVEDANVQDNIVFMGIRSNPYPYVLQSDIVVHPSDFEGKSIALDEAKILCKPIVVTNFSTVYDQFQDRINATICTMHPEDLANKIEELIINTDLKKQYITFLKSHSSDNTDEINKLYSIIELID